MFRVPFSTAKFFFQRIKQLVKSVLIIGGLLIIIIIIDVNPTFGSNHFACLRLFFAVVPFHATTLRVELNFRIVVSTHGVWQ
jgi:hypothetical protein